MTRIEFGDMIPDGIGDVFPNLRYIRIDAVDHVLNSIERRHLKNMENLQELNFYFVKIKIIAEDAFQDLINLEKLNLQDCDIEYFPEKLFWNLKKLKLLSLGGNPSTFISQDAFQDLSSLTNLVAPYKSNPYKSNALFNNWPNLYRLSFYKERIKKLERNFFTTLPMLTALHFSIGSIIGEISPDAFNDLINLQELILEGCEIENLHEETFWKLTKLKKLDLRENPLKIISENAFKGLSDLRYLSVSNCQIEKLPRNIFETNLNLEEIYLSESKFKIIEVDFTRLLRLRILNFYASTEGCVNTFFSATNSNSEASSIQKIQEIISVNCTGS